MSIIIKSAVYNKKFIGMGITDVEYTLVLASRHLFVQTLGRVYWVLNYDPTVLIFRGTDSVDD